MLNNNRLLILVNCFFFSLQSHFSSLQVPVTMFNFFPGNPHPLKRTLGALCAASALALSLAAPAAHATVIADQQNAVTIDEASFLCADTCNWQQTITAGRTGQLVGITLYGAGGTGDLRIGLGDGYLTGPWISEVQNAAIDGTTIDLRAFNIFLTAGQVFVADVLNATDSIFGTENAFGGPLWLSNADWGMEGFAWNGALAYTTFIDDGASAGVPIAPSWALLGIGLFALLAMRRAPTGSRSA